MLEIVVPDAELFDPKRSMFVTIKGQKLCLEHSLVSISKWESKWNKPFISKDPKTVEEIADYIKCMTITQNVRDEVYGIIDAKSIDKINAYINAPMTATWFGDDKSPKNNREVITSELIYYWMIAFNIPMECQKWHLNRLLTLIRVCSKKNEKPKKMSKRELMSRNTALNEARRKKLNSKG